MQLVECPACKAQVSQSAFQCVQCGHALRKPTRSMMGQVIKWTFIAFNILMVWWLFRGVGGAAVEGTATAASDAERAGVAIGTAIGASLVIFLWVAGDIILGLFVFLTRPKAA